MMRFLLLILSIFLTSISALSQEQLQNQDVEVVVTPSLTSSDLQNFISKKTRHFAEASPTSYELTQKDLSVNGLIINNKKFLILSPSLDDPKGLYNATLITTSAIANRYKNAGELDKAKHAQYGSVITLSSTLAIREMFGTNLSPATKDYISRALGLMVNCGIGVGKEVFYDRHHQDIHTVDARDALATCKGGFGIMLPTLQVQFWGL